MACVTLKAGDTYVCAVCEEMFVTTRSAEAVDADYARTFPAEHAAGVDTDDICDDCFIDFMIWWKEQRS